MKLRKIAETLGVLAPKTHGQIVSIFTKVQTELEDLHLRQFNAETDARERAEVERVKAELANAAQAEARGTIKALQALTGRK